MRPWLILQFGEPGPSELVVILLMALLIGGATVYLFYGLVTQDWNLIRQYREGEREGREPDEK